ncbi:hypothetical protein Pmani_019835 [Petrolisthes manimaculis]|uniref:Cytochrome b5 reductase 4 n=1 Tax=Petrolisthes manimaculis TaxID=1843537 RepID=A0AAE1PJZ9_9EUCA|nr:hypothetical protein Pmani_019835 [Petrolisthes manimaculis]
MSGSRLSPATPSSLTMTSATTNMLSPTTTASTLAPPLTTSLSAPTSGSATGNPRNKVALRPGRSLMDWVRLGHSGVDLTGTGGKVVDVTPQQLAKHNKRGDLWMSLRGKVYNVTAYLEFHPGGEDELMRGAGIDATTLFNEVHKWVNFETMLQKCLVGRLVEARPFFHKPSFLPLPKALKPNNNNNKKSDSSASKTLVVPSPSRAPVASPETSISAPSPDPVSTPVTSPWPLAPAPLPTPKYDWFQNDTHLTLAIYTRWSEVTPGHVVVVRKAMDIKVVCYIQDMTYTLHLTFNKPVREGSEVRAGKAGKVEVVLGKLQTGQRWSSLGKTLEGHGQYIKTRDREPEYVRCRMKKKENLTHDTRLMLVEVPSDTLLPVPMGYHVYIRLPGKENVTRPYTPVAPGLKQEEEKEELGRWVHLLVKIYPDGALTPGLDELEMESEVEVSLPEGTFTQDKVTAATTITHTLVLLAAGTGITPMIRLTLAALDNKRKVLFILFNKTEEDIPWRKELSTLMEQHSSLLTVIHVLSQPAEGWSGETGRVREELLEKYVPRPSSQQPLYLCVCGPTPFTKLTHSLLLEAGHSEVACHAFQS